MTDSSLRPQVLLVPGWTNSGPHHWQSLWESTHADYIRVEQRDWDHPIVSEWVDTLDRAVVAATHAPGHTVVLVAHSLGCLTVAHWAQQHPHHTRGVLGALLVAPPDVERPDTAPVLQAFAPIPLQPLPFPTVVVASTNDPYAAIERAEEMAKAWGARFVNAGAVGHMDSSAGLSDWPRGQEILADLRS